MMKDYINHDKGTAYTEYQVYKVMRYLGIKSRIRQKRRNCTIRAKDAKVAPNVLNRDFNEAIPNEKWVTDVTESRLPALSAFASEHSNAPALASNVSGQDTGGSGPRQGA